MFSSPFKSSLYITLGGYELGDFPGLPTDRFTIGQCRINLRVARQEEILNGCLHRRNQTCAVQRMQRFHIARALHHELADRCQIEIRKNHFDILEPVLFDLIIRQLLQLVFGGRIFGQIHQVVPANMLGIDIRGRLDDARKWIAVIRQI